MIRVHFHHLRSTHLDNLTSNMHQNQTEPGAYAPGSPPCVSRFVIAKDLNEILAPQNYRLRLSNARYPEEH